MQNARASLAVVCHDGPSADKVSEATRKARKRKVQGHRKAPKDAIPAKDVSRHGLSRGSGSAVADTDSPIRFDLATSPSALEGTGT